MQPAATFELNPDTYVYIRANFLYNLYRTVQVLAVILFSIQLEIIPILKEKYPISNLIIE